MDQFGLLSDPQEVVLRIHKLLFVRLWAINVFMDLLQEQRVHEAVFTFAEAGFKLFGTWWVR